MFFILSKVLSFLFQPIAWIAICIFLYFILKKKWKVYLLKASVIIFFVCSNPFLFHETIRLWEYESTNPNTLKVYDIGVVLGGMSGYDKVNGKLIFHGSIDRLLQTLDLYHKGKIRKVLITSGSGKLFDQEHKEGLLLKDYLIKLGFPKEDLLIESESRNTYENAKYTAELLKEQNFTEKILLISSAWHLPRAKACFVKAGIKTDVYATHNMAPLREYTPESILLPNSGTLSGWAVLFHELFGMFIYKLKGYA